jgi:hypothetical protein
MVERYVKTVEEHQRKGDFHAPEGLGWEAANIPAGLSRFEARHYRHDAC